jgi:hypothetical protein
VVSRSLTELANEHGSDKGTHGPSADWGAHNYTDVYEAYLEPLREHPITLLEIGLGVRGEQVDTRIVHGRNTGGASVKMWRDFFPRGTIYGIDLNECAYLDSERVRTFVADQGDIDDLRAFTEATGGIAFDVIIDDGSHRPDHQQISLGYFFDFLKPGGLYFIEDLQANGYGDGARGGQACEDVRSTRSTLRHLRDHGEVLDPHALADPERLAAEIVHIGLHVPRLEPRRGASRSRRRLHQRLWRRLRRGGGGRRRAGGRRGRRAVARKGRGMIDFLPESERLGVLRKRRPPAGASTGGPTQERPPHIEWGLTPT